MRLLLLSNSTNFGGSFLGHADDALRAFVGTEIHEALFVPYAAVRFSFEDFAAKVAEGFARFGCRIRPIHQEADPHGAVQTAQAIVVGGGNTFQLLDRLQREGLITPMGARVRAGAAYVGWSAGANLACPTIRTTNDMPIVEPSSFEALSLVSFQINPHYTEERIPNHGGESRVERLLEFVTANPDMPVVALREGSMLEVLDGTVRLLGNRPAIVFRAGKEPRTVGPGPIEVG